MLFAFVVFTLISRGRRAPDVIIDEILYGQMARGIASGAGTTWRGEGVGLHTLYAYLIAPGWIAGGPVSGYAIARAIGAFAACTVAVPAWMIGRELLDDWRRWIAPVATLAGSWMIFSGRLLAENLAFPLAVGSLAALTIALARERARGWLLAACTLALLAAATRIQLVVLFGVIPAALLIDLARDERSALRRRLAHRVADSAPSASLLALPVITALLGRYSGALDSVPAPSELFYWLANNIVELALMTGVVPLVALVALSLRSENWRDRKIGAFLAVAVPATVLLLLQVSWFGALHAQRPIDRYLIYVVPLLFVALGLAAGRIRVLHGVFAAAVIGLLTIGVSGPLGAESDAISAMTARGFGWNVHDVMGSLAPLAALAAVIGVAGTLLLARAGSPSAGRGRMLTISVCALLGIQLIVGSQWSWHFADARAANVEKLMPADRQWVDHAGAGDVALLEFAPVFGDIAYSNEFFNDRVKRAYRLSTIEHEPPDSGASCRADLVAGGRLTVAPGCQPLPHHILAVGHNAAITFSNARSVDAPAGKQISLIETNGAPRLQSIVISGCGDAPVSCVRLANLRLISAKPTTLSLGVKGGSADSTVIVGNRRFAVPSLTLRKITVPVAAGDSLIEVKLAISAKRATPPTLQQVALGAVVIYDAAVNAAPPAGGSLKSSKR